MLEKLNLKQAFIISIIVLIGTYLFMPDMITKDPSGGSCYQGISEVINKFLLIILTITILANYLFFINNRMNLFYANLMIFAFVLFCWALFIISNYNFKGFLYITPFLISLFLYGMKISKLISKK